MRLAWARRRPFYSNLSHRSHTNPRPRNRERNIFDRWWCTTNPYYSTLNTRHSRKHSPQPTLLHIIPNRNPNPKHKALQHHPHFYADDEQRVYNQHKQQRHYQRIQKRTIKNKSTLVFRQLPKRHHTNQRFGQCGSQLSFATQSPHNQRHPLSHNALRRQRRPTNIRPTASNVLRPIRIPN